MFYWFSIFACQGTQTIDDTASDPQEDTGVEQIIEDGQPLYETVILQLLEGEPDSEVLQEGIEQVWVHDGMMLTRHEQGWSLRYPNTGEWVSLVWEEEQEALSFGVTPDDSILISTASGLWTLDGNIVRKSPLSDMFTEPVASMDQDDHILWLHNSSGLFQHKNGFLRSITIDEQPIEGDFIAGGLGDGFPVLWCILDSGVVELQVQGTSVITKDMFSQEGVLGVEKNSDGVWAFSETGVWRKNNQEWVILDGVLEIERWYSDPHSPTLWMMDFEQKLSWIEGDDVFSTDIRGELLGVDSAGRALVLQEGILKRFSPENRLAIRNIPLLELDKTVTISLDAMYREQVEDVTIQVDEQRQEAYESTLELIPSVFEDGNHTVKAIVSYTDGAVVVQEASFQIGAEKITWDDHIAPLSVGNCLSCHAGGTNTELHTKERWVEEIDLILSNVEDGFMPLGDDMLRPDELAYIRAWKDGGFE